MSLIIIIVLLIAIAVLDFLIFKEDQETKRLLKQREELMNKKDDGLDE
ncbi:hypothetical protein L2001_07745 [Lactobacillus mulieris]|nr:hypothetical protein [Lactobacillus mulieris]MCZ9649876.1 hypothetical protein [Lactobacillus mulieris]MCZ9720145.1 hypothetical protein [Lactobacillus mulieris]